MKKSHFGVKSGGEIMSKAEKDYLPWKECKLGEVVAIISERTSINDASLENYISTENMISNFGGVQIADKLPVANTINSFQKEDVLFSNIRTYFKKVWCSTFSGTVSPDVLVFRANGCDKKFLYYQMCNPEFTEYTVLTSRGAKMPRGDKEAISQYDILLPPLPEQRAIAGVLSSLDDKIDLLHRQNKTLEAMAETLFRQWFVEEADEEWEEKPLSYIANFLNGLACQKFPPQNEIEKLPVLKIRELNNGITEASDWATSNVNQEYIVDLGDIIFAWSASLMVKIWDGEKCVLNQHLFKVTSEKYPKWFYLYWTKHHLDEFIAISKSHATTMGHIKRKDLDNAMVLLPSNKELNQMTKIMEPIVEKKIKNYQQLSILKKFHDILLPKLMNGEVRISSQMELT